MNVFSSKKHLAFLTIERYDRELTNMKISNKNICTRWYPGPSRGIIITITLRFYWFWCKMLRSQQKNFKFKILWLMVYIQHHSDDGLILRHDYIASRIWNFMSSGFVEWNCAIAIINTSLRHYSLANKISFWVFLFIHHRLADL